MSEVWSERDLKELLDYPTATLVMTDDTDRHYIGEALLTAAALFLLQRYCVGILKGMGLDAMAEKHGERINAFLTVTRAHGADSATIKCAADEARELSASLDALRIDEEFKARAAAEVEEFLFDLGATRSQARSSANKVRARGPKGRR